MPPAASADVLRGYVLDPESLPVVGVKVLVVQGDRVRAVLVTDDHGAFGPSAQLPAGAYDIFVAAPGFYMEPRHTSLVDGAQIREINLGLVPAAASEYVVVSGTTADQLRTRVTDSVAVLDRPEISALQAPTLADVLRVVPGIHVIAAGGAGAPTTVVPEGGKPEFVLVLVDGIPQSAFGGVFNAADLSTIDVQTVEVTRGSTSVVYGIRPARALINVLTRQRSNGVNLDGLVEGTTFPGARMAVTARASHGSWNWSLGGEHLQSDGANGQTGDRGVVANDDYARTFGSASVGWHEDPQRNVRATLRVRRSEKGFAGPWGADPGGFNPAIDLVTRERTRDLEAGLWALLQSGPFIHHDVQLAWSRVASDFANADYRSQAVAKQFVARYRLDVEMWKATAFSSGLSHDRERADDALVRDAAGLPLPLVRVTTGWFGEIRHSVRGRLYLTAGLQAQLLRRNAIAANTDPQVWRPAIAAENIVLVLPKIAASWFVRTNANDGWTKLRFDSGEGARPPTARELGFTENPVLRTERTRSMAAGVEHAFAAQRVIIEAGWFRHRDRDLILTLVVPQHATQRLIADNIEDVRISGATLSVTARTASGLVARAVVTWMRADVGRLNAADDTWAPVAAGDPLPRRPTWQGASALTWVRPWGSAFVMAFGRARMPDLEPSRGTQVFDNPGFISVSAGGSLALVRHAEIFVRLTNLTDRRYEEVLGYPAPRRAVAAGLRVSLR
jgi:outer membrane cobalamin receptor